MQSSELLSHADFVARLAAQLLRDEHGAADAAQEAWLSACEHPPRTSQNLRGWIAVVVRNVVRRLRNRDAARKSWERSAAAAEAAPSAAEVVERAELRNRIAQAVLELDEPYRTTILYRFYENLSPARIAAIQKVPVETVRTRLKRSLVRLRARLDRELGGASSWTMTLAPLAGIKIAAPGAACATSNAACAASGGAAAKTLLSGGFLMATKLKIGIAAIGLGLAAGGFCLWQEMQNSPQKEPAPVVEAPAALAAAGADSAGPIAEGTPEDPERVRITPAGADSPAAPGAQLGTARVDGRFVDEAGLPIQGVQVTDWISPGADAATSGWDGRFEIVASILENRGPEVQVRAEKEGFRQPYLAARATHSREIHFGDVVLEPAGNCTITGVVVDPQGAPVPHAWVDWVSARGHGGDQETVRLTGNPADTMDRRSRNEPNVRSDGTFRLGGIHAGKGRLAATAPAFLYTFSGVVELQPHQELAGLRLVLDPVPPEKLVSGVVLDPEGQPFPGASIKVTCWHDRTSCSMAMLRSDSFGRFTYVLGAPRPHSFEASVKDNRFGPLRVDEVREGTCNLVLQFPAPSYFPVTLSAAKGSLPDLLAIEVCDAESSAHEARALRVFYVRHQEDAEGRIWLRVPDEPFLVVVEAEGFDRAVAGPYDPAAFPHAQVVLQPLAEVAGQVFAAGEPLAGAKVGLFSSAPSGIQTINGSICRSVSWPAAQGESGEDGRFRLPLRESGTFYLRAETEGWAAGENGPLEIDQAAGAADLRVDLTPGGAIEGYLRPRDGQGREGVIIAISRGDGFTWTVRTDAAGFYRFEHLTPGLWHVRETAKDMNLGGNLIVLETPHAGEYHLTVEEDGSAGILIRDTVRVEFEAVAWARSVPTGRLVVHSLQPDRSGVPAYYYWKGSGGLEVFVPINAGPDGTAELAVVPAGNGQVHVLGWDREASRKVDRVLAEVAVPEGGLAEIDLAAGRTAPPEED